MFLQPPSNMTLNDSWLAGLILAFLVWAEMAIIIFLVIKLRATAKLKTNDRNNESSKGRYKPTNLPKE